MNNITDKKIKQISMIKSSARQHTKLVSFDDKLAYRASTCSRKITSLTKQNISTQDIKVDIQPQITCNLRFCPMCNYYKVKTLTPQIYSQLAQFKDKNVSYLMLTISPRTVDYKGLRATIQAMNYAFRIMTNTVFYKKYCVAWIRTLEITFKMANGMAHPHFHCCLVMKNEYFKSKDYLKTADWAKLFNRIFKQNIPPMTDVRKLYKKNYDTSQDMLLSGIKELSKYITKPSDLSILTIDDMEIIHKQLSRLRFITTSRNIKINEKLEIDAIDEFIWELIEKIFWKYNQKSEHYEIEKISNDL